MGRDIQQLSWTFSDLDGEKNKAWPEFEHILYAVRRDSSAYATDSGNAEHSEAGVERCGWVAALGSGG